MEVDGSQHKNKIQADRDIRKDRLIQNAGLKIIRLSTTTIDCKQKIENALNKSIIEDSEIYENKLNSNVI